MSDDVTITKVESEIKKLEPKDIGALRAMEMAIKSNETLVQMAKNEQERFVNHVLTKMGLNGRYQIDLNTGIITAVEEQTNETNKI